MDTDVTLVGTGRCNGIWMTFGRAWTSDREGVRELKKTDEREREMDRGRKGGLEWVKVKGKDKIHEKTTLLLTGKARKHDKRSKICDIYRHGSRHVHTMIKWTLSSSAHHLLVDTMMITYIHIHIHAYTDIHIHTHTQQT